MDRSAILFRSRRRATATTLLVCGLALAPAARAQVEPIEGFTPSALQPGAPVGSFPLSGFEQVVPYSGALNVALPLVQVQGRGGARTLLALQIQPKWHVTWREQASEPRPRYSLAGLPGRKRPNYGFGRVVGRRGQEEFSTKAVTRFTASTPDGTEYEFRDAVFDGEPRSGFSLNRGRLFSAWDGSAASLWLDADFIETATSLVYRPGYVLLRDGTRLRVATDGSVDWMQDRNGNRVDFSYGVDAANVPRVTQAVDSLGRVVDVSYGDDAVGPTVDTIAYKGFGRAPRTVTINWARLDALFTPGQGYVVQARNALFPGLGGTDIFDPRLPASVVLPDGRSYGFTYNPYGEIEEITLPTGAVIRYEYAAGLQGGAASGYFHVPGQKDAIYRRVVRREVYENGVNLTSVTTFSRPELLGPGGGLLTDGYVDVQTLEPDGTLRTFERHHYFGAGAASSLLAEGADYTGWTHGREWLTETFDTDSVTRLRRVQHGWTQGGTVAWWTGPSNDAPPKNPRPLYVDTTLDDGQVARQAFSHDAYNNRTEVQEYDFGAGAPGALQRRTTASFVTSLTTGGTTWFYDSNMDIHIRDLPLQVAVYDGGGTLRSLTTNEWDQYAGTGNAALVARADMVGHDPAYLATGKLTRGNLTKVQRWWDAGPPGVSLVETRQQYDVAGNTVRSFDGRGFATDLDYADRFGSPDAEAQSNTRPPELPTGATYAFATRSTNPKSHVAYTQFDYWIGQPVNVEDANAVVSSVSYADAFERPTEVVVAANQTAAGSPRAKTTFTYDDAARVVTTRRDRDTLGDGFLKTEAVHDRLGRNVERWSYESANDGILALTEYDAAGRVSFSSNPYRPDLGETPVWTETAYDGLGRVLATLTPDSAATTFAYSGSQATVTDPAGKKRRTSTDALGRVAAVVEDPDALAYSTSYQYHVSDQVALVTQGVQSRSFTYDSLGRLKTAANPESGTLTYSSYDADGNLLERKDARAPQVTVSQTFDALGRLLVRSYSDGTPAVTWSYDGDDVTGGIPLSKGRTTRVSSSASVSRNTAFDALGRVKASQQVTAGQTFGFQYTYDLAGNLRTETYPSGRVVTTAYDRAGRVASVTDPSGFHADTFSYAAHGAVAGLRFGNSVAGAERWESTSFNSRLQTTQIGLGSASGLADVLRLQFKYGNTQQFDNEPTNNGNITWHQVRHVVPAGSICFTQGYGYDALNRLSAVAEATGNACSQPTAPRVCDAGTALAWCQRYDYDRFGNRAVAFNRSYAPAGLTPTSLGQYSAATNKILASTYDGAGNQLTDIAARTFTYDGENRQRTFSGGGANASYDYDGDGRRVRATVNGQATLFAYDAFGKLAAEYGLAVAGAAATRRYLGPDVLGSTRFVHDQGRAVLARHDFLPFGEEIPAGVNGRSAVPGYAFDDKVRQKFTGQPRDSESGLDFFSTRYASAAQGRFTGADQPLVGQWNEQPQSWHLYAYTSNNPVNRVDPNGQDWFTKEGEAPVWIPCDSKGNCAVDPPEGYERWTPEDAQDTLRWEMGPVTFFLRPDGRYDWDAPVQDISWETAGQISIVMGGARLAWGAGRAGLSLLAARNASQRVMTGVLRACFAAGTLVATAQGQVPIERLAPGDLVTSLDPATRVVSERPVVRTFQREVKRLLVLEIAGEAIHTTDEHPFWVPGAGWIKAGDLRPGARLSARDGREWAVDAVRHVEQPTRVYNLEVEAPHTYLVSAKALLVHNKSMPAMRPSSSLTKPSASWLKRNGVDPHKLKSDVGAGGESDIFKDSAGNLWLKVKGAADETAEFLGHISHLQP